MPRLTAIPSGCAFHPRCPQAIVALTIDAIRAFADVEHDVGQVERGEGVEQRGEPGDLTGLALHPGVDTDLAQHHPSVLIDDREQVPGTLGRAAGAAEGLAVHREHPTPRTDRVHHWVADIPAGHGAQPGGEDPETTRGRSDAR